MRPLWKLLARKMNDWWTSIEFITRWSLVSNWTVAITTIVAAISGVAALLLSQQKEVLGDRIKAAADVERLETDRQRDLQISGNELETKKSVERTAVLEVENSRLKLELAQVQDRLAPRTISPAMRATFLEISAGIPKGKVCVSFLAGDDEAIRFTMALVSMLAEAGYDVPKSRGEMNAVAAMSSPVVGTRILVWESKTPVAVGLQNAFRAIGIDAIGELIPPLPPETPRSGSMFREEVNLYIGTKP